MRRSPPPEAERGRIRTGPLASDKSWGNTGAFVLRSPEGEQVHIIVSDGMGWEHVSVSCENRTPTWREMCWAKDLFWQAEETVIQFHPPRSEYVNAHEFCLHLWKPTEAEIPRPPTWMVGPGRQEARRAS